MNELLKLLRSPRFRLAAIAVALGIVSTLLVQAYVSRTIEAISGGELIPVVAAARSMQPGEAIQASDLTIRQMPVTYAHIRAIPAANVQLLVGQKPNVAIQAGQTILWTEIYLPGQTGLSDLLRVNERAVSIKVDQASSFSGMIRPGDRVDVLAVSRGGGLGAPATLKVLLQSALLIAVDDRTRLAPPGPEAGVEAPGGAPPTSSRGVSTVTLRVSADDAPRLALADAQDRIVLLLRNPTDVFTTTMPDLAAAQPATGVTQSSLLDEKVANYPEVYQGGNLTGNGYYPPPSMAAKELRELSPQELQRRVLEYSGAVMKQATPGTGSAP